MKLFTEQKNKTQNLDHHHPSYKNLIAYLKNGEFQQMTIAEYKEALLVDKGSIYYDIYEGRLLELPEDADPYHKLYLDYVNEIWKAAYRWMLVPDVEERILELMFPVNHTQVISAMRRALLKNVRYNYLEFHFEFAANGKKITKEQLNGFFNTIPRTKSGRSVLERSLNANVFFHDILDENRFYPSVEWVDELDWDGVDRLDELCNRVLNIQSDFEKLLVKTALKSALNRWGFVGAKNDNVLVLQGKQGARKSGFIAAIAPLDKFVSTSKFEGKDDLLRLHRKLLVEFGEIEQITNKKDSESVKEFIQNQVDNFRVPYGEMDADYPRAFSCWGSANGESFLKDTSGSRRFFIIRIPHDHKIDVEWVRKNRDQIWAQIKEDKTIMPYLSPADEMELQHLNKGMYVEDDLLNRIQAVLDEQPEECLRAGVLRGLRRGGSYVIDGEKADFPFQAAWLYRIAYNTGTDEKVSNADTRKIGEWLVNNGYTRKTPDGKEIRIRINTKQYTVFQKL